MQFNKKRLNAGDEEYADFIHYPLKRIEEELKRRGLSMADLSSLVGRNPRFVDTLLRSKGRDMRLSTLYMLAEGLGMKWKLELV